MRRGVKTQKVQNTKLVQCFSVASSCWCGCRAQRFQTPGVKPSYPDSLPYVSSLASPYSMKKPFSGAMWNVVPTWHGAPTLRAVIRSFLRTDLVMKQPVPSAPGYLVSTATSQRWGWTELQALLPWVWRLPFCFCVVDCLSLSGPLSC